MGTLTVGTQNIDNMKVAELRDLLDSKGIPYKAQHREAGLIKIIRGCGLFDVERKDGGKKDENGKLIHPVHGEYVRCIVHPQGKYNQSGAIYVGINKYSATFNPRVPVKLPKGVIKFLRGASDAKHEFDKTAISENGNVGAHVTVQVPKYVVEILLDDD